MPALAADLSQVYTALRNADAAGDTAAAKQLAAYIQAQSAAPAAAPAPTTPDTIKLGFTRNAQLDTHIPMPQGLGNFLGGVGEGVYNLAQGAMQDVGLRSRADIQNWRQLQALMPKSGARTAGNVTGDVLAAAPAALIPGANTLLGGAAIGAGLGLLQPSTSTGETLENVGLGAAAAPGTLLAGRAIHAIGSGVKAAAEPLLAGGQSRIAARTLQSFAGSPQNAGQVASILDRYKPKVSAGASLPQVPGVLPGVAPTTAELGNNAGLAQLERSLRNNPELTTVFNERDAANRGAMTGAVNAIAGTPEARAAAVAARSSTAAPLYDAAKSATVQADDKLRGILARPSMQTAWARAQKLAQENGDELVSGKDVPEQVLNSPLLDADGKPFSVTIPAESARYSGKAIQYLKMALNDIADTGQQTGMGAHESRAVKSTLGDLNSWTQANVPALRAADKAYQALSAPINRMDVGKELSNRLVPALGDFGNNTRLNAASFTNALRNGDDIAANVLGRNSASLADVMTPKQMQTLRQVGEQLARRANAQEAGRAVGSNTAQNLIGQNLIRQILGPLGLPQSLAERAAQSSLGQTIMRPAQWALRAGEGPILNHLGQAALDPQYAAGLLRAQPAAVNLQRRAVMHGLLAPLGASAAYAIKQ